MKFIDWFAGIGGFRRGMELAGHECVGFCEFDKFATASYISMHLLTDEQRKKLNELPQKKRQKEILKDEYRNGEWYANDVRRVCADDIPKADCWCFGFPCFAKGTYILTEKGYIPIEDVSVGDKVLTHKGRWRKVTATMHRDGARLWDVNGFGILPTRTTAEHPYYVTKPDQPMEFKKVEQLDDSWYSTMVLPDAESDGYSKEMWWIIGRYLADGWRVERKDRPSGGRIVFAISMIRGQNSNSDCEKRNYMELTQKNELVESIMCAITNYTNTLKSSENTHMENEFQEKHCVCHERKQNTFSMDICPGMEEVIEKKQHQPAQHSFLACALLHSDLENLFQLFTALEEMKNVLSKEGNADKEIHIHSESLVNQLKDIIVQDMFAENCISQQNLMILEQCITSVLKKTTHMLQTEQLSTIAKISQLPESNLDFKETVQACFSELCTLSDSSKKKINRLPFIENVKNLLSVNGGWDFARLLIEMEQGGMMQNGKCSTPKISECHKTERGASLSDILEGEVRQKYFLSKEQTEKIVFR